MVRFFFFFAFITLYGVFIFAQHQPQLITTFVFWILGILFAAVVLKIALDFYLDHKKDEEDEADRKRVLREEQAQTFYDIRSYSEAIRRRENRR